MLFNFLIFKILLMCSTAIIIRGTLPRYRFDQLIHLNWKHFLFIWIGFFFVNFNNFILFI